MYLIWSSEIRKVMILKCEHCAEVTVSDLGSSVDFPIRLFLWDMMRRMLRKGDVGLLRMKIKKVMYVCVCIYSPSPPDVAYKHFHV